EKNCDARIVGRRSPVIRRQPTATEVEAQLAKHAKVLADEGVWHRARTAPGRDIGSRGARGSVPLPGGFTQGLHTAPPRVSASASRCGCQAGAHRTGHRRDVESCRRSVTSIRRLASLSFARAVWSSL